MPNWTRPGHALAPRRSTIWKTILAIVLLVAAAFVAARLDPLPPDLAGRAQAADGDSLRMGKDRIRLLGMDAPELDQPCWDGDEVQWACGRLARTELARLVAAGPVLCRPEGTDRYGRTLARCTVDGNDLGAAMVRAGYALATDAYAAEQAAAKSDRLGVWQGRFTEPRTWRKEGLQGDPGPGPLHNLWKWFRELTGARTLR